MQEHCRGKLKESAKRGVYFRHQREMGCSFASLPCYLTVTACISGEENHGNRNLVHTLIYCHRDICQVPTPWEKNVFFISTTQKLASEELMHLITVMKHLEKCLRHEDNCIYESLQPLANIS